MNIIHIDSIDHPGVEIFSTLTEAQLRNKLEPEKGIFIVESPKVIKVAMQAGYEPVALLTESKHIDGDAADIVSQLGNDIPIYTGSRDVLASLTGYKLTRGVLCAMKRPAPPTLAATLEGAQRIVVIDGVVDTTNIGAIFRSAAALGIDAVILTRNSCDPLNRRAVRVSMGSIFLVPWTWIDEEDISGLKSLDLRPWPWHSPTNRFRLTTQPWLMRKNLPSLWAPRATDSPNTLLRRLTTPYAYPWHMVWTH